MITTPSEVFSTATPARRRPSSARSRLPPSIRRMLWAWPESAPRTRARCSDPAESSASCRTRSSFSIRARAMPMTCQSSGSSISSWSPVRRSSAATNVPPWVSPGANDSRTTLFGVQSRSGSDSASAGRDQSWEPRPAALSSSATVAGTTSVAPVGLPRANAAYSWLMTGPAPVTSTNPQYGRSLRIDRRLRTVVMMPAASLHRPIASATSPRSGMPSACSARLSFSAWLTRRRASRSRQRASRSPTADVFREEADDRAGQMLRLVDLTGLLGLVYGGMTYASRTFPAREQACTRGVRFITNRHFLNTDQNLAWAHLAGKRIFYSVAGPQRG